jgi:hypothetical protein
MTITTRNPGAGDAGARKSDQLATAIGSEHNRSLVDLQALFVERRLRVPPALATTIAMLAFYGRRT